MNKPSFETGEIIWPVVTGLIIIQLAVSMLTFFIYPFFIWAVFGEGADSFLYSNINTVVYVVFPILLPTLLNLYRIYKAKKDKRNRTAKAYMCLEAGLLFTYALTMFWWGRTHNFYF